MQQPADYQRRLHPPPPPPDSFSQYFPLGLKVLLVGIDNATQNSIQKQLRPPHYYITHCHTGSSALQHLLDKDSSFDLILSDVFLQDMDGYQFVRRQRSNTNIPHVLISGLERSSSIKTAYKSGVCYVLWKPVSDSELKNLWQHVCRRREQGDDFFDGDVDDHQNHQQQQNQLLVRKHNPPHHQDECCSSSLVVSRDISPKVEDDREFLNNHHGDQQRSSKKPRVVWSGQLHQSFLDAVNCLGGVEKAVPKAILEGMNMSFLTRENVASHLQKYRMYLRKMADKQLHENQHMNAMAGNRMPSCNGRGEGSYGRFIGNNNISPQPVTVRLHPDTRTFQNPNNNNNPHLLEHSRNNSPPLPHLPDEGTFLWSLAHHGHHSNQPHHHHHPMQMRMQPPPQQNFSFDRQVVPLAMVPSSAFAGNGSNMQQQKIAQNLISSGVQQQQLDQNLALASCHGNKMKQFDQNLASASCHGGNMQHHQDQNLASASCHGGNMQHHQDQNLASGTSFGSNMQITQNLTSGIHHLESSQNLASSSCPGGNMQHHQDQNLASGTSYGSNMQITQNLTSGIHHLESSQNLASSSCPGGNMQHVDQNLASGSFHGNNMQNVDQNLASGSYVTTTRGGNNNDGIIKSEAAPVIRDRDDDDEFFDNFDDNLDEAIPNLLMADPHHTQYQLHD